MRLDFYDLHKNEILTDNTQFHEYDECKDCKHWGNRNDYFTNAYNKGCCDVYPYPDSKPTAIALNEMKCEYKETR